MRRLWTLAVVTTLAVLGLSSAALRAEPNVVDEDGITEKQNDANFDLPRASNWLSSRPRKAFSANDDISYLLQYLEKRGDSGEGVRDIRSPLGTMRFGKRNNPLGTMRFGKRAAGPLGTMRFGKRAESPLGTMRFGKRSSSLVYNPELV